MSRAASPNTKPQPPTTSSPQNPNKKPKPNPSTPPPPPSASQTPPLTPSSQNQSTEELLASQLQKCQRLAHKRPLEPTYEYLLHNSHQIHHHHHSAKPPRIVKDKLYRKFGANLRNIVESYMDKYGAESVVGAEQGAARGIGRYRRSLEDGAMKAAFTLKDGKEKEQKGLIKAALGVAKRRRLPTGWNGGMGGGVGGVGGVLDEGMRQKKMEAMALGLLERLREKDGELLNKARKKILAAEKASLEKGKAKAVGGGGDGGGGASDHRNAKAANAANEKMEKEHQLARDKEIEDRNRLREREKNREKARRLAEQKEREQKIKEEEEALRKARLSETSEEALHRLYEPIFRKLWDMEFANLHNTNPFRIVIDASNCAAMGCPDYVDVVKVPMNLTFIKDKVDSKTYETLQEFFQDVKLLISNALLYNSDPNNEYHKAANVLKKEFQKMGKKVMNDVQQQL